MDVCLDNCSLGSYSEAAVRSDSNKKALRRLSSPFQATPAFNWSHWQRLVVEGSAGGGTNFPLKLNPLVRGICIANWALSYPLSSSLVSSSSELGFVLTAKGG